jgi:hypothetical protein
LICFQEITGTGFGDRLRGIAFMLHTAEKIGATEVLYNDDEAADYPGYRKAAFPSRMTDLIRIKGLSFRYHPLPLPENGYSIVYNSMTDWKEPSRLGRLLRFHYGFQHMHRLRPLDEAVTERVSDIGVDRGWLGFHIRRTDNEDAQKRYFNEKSEYRVLQKVRRISEQYQSNRLFIAADNHRSYTHWYALLHAQGYEVMGNNSEYDQESLRQTGNFDMMVDFFGLAACQRIIRLSPSEFSRFAAWVGGQQMGYRQLT